LQCLTYVCGFLETVFPEEMDLVVGPIKDNFVKDVADNAWRHDLDLLTADVQPFMCHSHNDYWRKEPLFSAIHAGCTGVEADLWFLSDELYVAHTPSGIRRNRTLRTLYLDPLMELLDQRNVNPDFVDPSMLDSYQSYRRGVFDARPKQSLVLLIDFKNKDKPSDDEIWRRLDLLLEPFRAKGYLSYVQRSVLVNGPLTVVVSGSVPLDRLFANSTHRDIFYDAPLHDLETGLDISPIDTINGTAAQPSEFKDEYPPVEHITYTPFNSYYASTSFKRSIGYPFHSSLSQSQLQKIRHQIRTAHGMGLKVRYWGIPAWPIGVRNYLWRVLVREGVDYLSVDDIDDVRFKDWGPRKGGWGKKWWR
jgi:hypothetical protein